MTVVLGGRPQRDRRIDVLSRALAPAPEPARLEIIGDGTRRTECSELTQEPGQGSRA